nr:hypothetical protein Itr_chr07CG03880 [Ipomoea trifida]
MEAIRSIAFGNDEEIKVQIFMRSDFGKLADPNIRSGPELYGDKPAQDVILV